MRYTAIVTAAAVAAATAAIATATANNERDVLQPQNPPAGGIHWAQGRAPAAGPHRSPNLTYHGGPVMSTQSTGDQVVVTPIFWEPSGFAFTTSYKNTITSYLDGLK